MRYSPKHFLASIRSTVAVAACLAGVVSLMQAVPAAHAETVRYSDHDALGGMRTDFVREVWLPEIAEQSNDAITVRDYFGGTLLGPKEVLKGLGDGIVKLAYIYPGHHPDQLIAHSIFPLLPRGPARFENMVWFYRQLYERVPAFREELARANWEPLMLTAGLPGAFAATYPAKSMKDLQGRKWRASGNWPLRYLGNAGATPVSIPWDDLYISLQTGTVEGVYTNYDGIHMAKLDEVASNILLSKALWFATPMVHGANKAWFDALPAEQQDAIRAASQEAERRFAEVYDQTFEKIRADQIAAGYSVVELTDDDVALWENAEKLPELQQTWVAEAEAAGLENAAEVMEQVRAIHAEAMQRP